MSLTGSWTINKIPLPIINSLDPTPMLSYLRLRERLTQRKRENDVTITTKSQESSLKNVVVLYPFVLTDTRSPVYYRRAFKMPRFLNLDKMLDNGDILNDHLIQALNDDGSLKAELDITDAKNKRPTLQFSRLMYYCYRRL